MLDSAFQCASKAERVTVSADTVSLIERNRFKLGEPLDPTHLTVFEVPVIYTKALALTL